MHSVFTLSRPSTPLLLVPLLAGMLLLATGCSSTHRVTEPSGGQEASRSDTYGYSQVTEDVSGETVRVSLRNGQWMELENLYVGPDSTTGALPQGGKKTVPTSALQKIEVVDHGIRTLGGVVLAVGGTLAGLYTMATADDDEFLGELDVLGGLVLTITAPLVGASLATQDQGDVYRFPQSPSQSDTTAVSTEDPTERIRRQKN